MSRSGTNLKYLAFGSFSRSARPHFASLWQICPDSLTRQRGELGTTAGLGNDGVAQAHRQSPRSGPGDRRIEKLVQNLEQSRIPVPQLLRLFKEDFASHSQELRSTGRTIAVD